MNGEIRRTFRSDLKPSNMPSFSVFAQPTVELIVENTTWTPPPARYTADALVYLQIETSDMPMRLKVKEAGGRWNPEKRLWLVKYGKIARTPLEKHIQVDAS